MRNLCNTCIHEEVCGIEDHGEDAIKYCIDHYPKPINCKHCLYGVGDDPANMEDYYSAIKDAPTIDAEPVRHGRCDMCEIMESGHWIRLYNGNGWDVGIGRRIDGYELVISHCGEHFATKIDYCPYCGAKLDGGEKKNE